MVQCTQIGRHGMMKKIKWITFTTLGIAFIIGSNVWLAKRDAKLFNQLNSQPQLLNYEDR